MKSIELLRQTYRSKLKESGTPLDPSVRTPDQEQTAALCFWAAKTEITLDVGSLAQVVVETADDTQEVVL